MLILSSYFVFHYYYWLLIQTFTNNARQLEKRLLIAQNQVKTEERKKSLMQL